MKEEEAVYLRNVPEAIAFFSEAIAKIQNFANISNDELIFELGKRIGRAAGKKMKSTNLEGLMMEISQLWKEMGLSDLEVDEASPLRFTVSKCTNCNQLPNLAPLRCHFHEGVFQGIIDEKLGEGLRVVQSESQPDEGGTIRRRFEIVREYPPHLGGIG